MKQIKLTLSIFSIFFVQGLVAQDYLGYMQQGKFYFNKHRYITALERFDFAYDLAKSDLDKSDAKKWKSNSLKKLRKSHKEMEKKLKSNDRALIYAKTMIDAIYFFDDKVALAYKDGKYGYIRKDGSLLINYKYDLASPFNEISGFAKVSYNKKSYLIDTTGREYLLAESVGALTSGIEALDISKQHLSDLPKIVFNYPELKVLLISNNKIASFPAEIARLKELSHLDASNNNLNSIPAEIGELKNLKFVSLRGNSITKLPIEISKLQKLMRLDLADNQLFDLPRGIASLYELKSLVLDGNRISNMSPDIGLLVNLHYLSVQSNSMNELPSEIGRLSRLRTLYLAENSLTDLPREIGRLLSLENLRLSRNQLSYLPIEIKQLNQLKYMDMRSNPVSNQKRVLISSWLNRSEVIF